MKTRPGAELFRAVGLTGRQTDMTKLIVVFRNFASASENVMYIIISVFLTYFLNI